MKIREDWLVTATDTTTQQNSLACVQSAVTEGTAGPGSGVNR